MFEVGDILKHKHSGQHFLVLEKHVFLNRNIERVEYTVLPLGAGGGAHIRIHYPLMTTNYEKIA